MISLVRFWSEDVDVGSESGELHPDDALAVLSSCWEDEWDIHGDSSSSIPSNVAANCFGSIPCCCTGLRFISVNGKQQSQSTCLQGRILA